MSDTPRTDAASISREYIERETDRYTQKFVLADHMGDLERELAEAKAEITRLKGEAESWEKVFDRTCEHLADAKSKLAEAVAKERDKPNSTYQTVLAMAAKIRKGE